MLRNINNKIFSVWKPSGILSNDIIYAIRKKYNVKAGHAGTLDPFAEGVLLVCTGTKTKEISVLQLELKKYTAKINLGCITDTLDSDGKIIFRKDIPSLTIDGINMVLRQFTGKVMQRPPAFSAIRINNVRLYSLARNDIFLNLKPREVFIDSLTLKKNENNFLIIEVVCKSGTYIRALARDIASALGTCGYLHSLKREYIGKYNFDNSYLYKEILDGSL